MERKSDMISQIAVLSWKLTRAFCCVVLLTMTDLGTIAQEASTSPASAPAGRQETFASPKQAAEALIQAAANYDLPALQGILGPGSEDILASQDPVQAKNNALAFAKLANDKQEVTVDPKNANRAILSVGAEDWPLPIPMVKKQGKWSFDTNAGRQEILFRRIGSNELDAIAICRGYVDAQQEYSGRELGGPDCGKYRRCFAARLYR